MNLLPLPPLQLQAINRGASAVRVPMVPQPPKEVVEIYPLTDLSNRTVWVGRNADEQSDKYGHSLFEKESPFKPGDVVAIGEEWKIRTYSIDNDALVNRNEVCAVLTIRYRDGSLSGPIVCSRDLTRKINGENGWSSDWQPASSMPLEFARHFRVIGDTKAVRCQDGFADDWALIVGAEPPDGETMQSASIMCDYFQMVADIHGPDYWERNCWEWQYELTERKGGAGHV